MLHMFRLGAALARALHRRTRARGDAGEQTTGFILIVALAVSIALTVGAILTSTLTDAAESIDLGIEP
ncbi:hypothetical protein CLV63_11247 [Murinocardiopsis flavida]|uniref:Uncharacterized protein n=1 Tax=Murinocardiopsis flavida TaxID=645275 RepID=A0A2P8DG21_9ACTN|nr:hypothetical protein [Murinocardiopsis flavida]PSK96165.1 hypothetical protein CLV63_11247 [Murinocardiopsis flavida]